MRSAGCGWALGLCSVLIVIAACSSLCLPACRAHGLLGWFVACCCAGARDQCLSGLVSSTQKAVAATAHNCWVANQAPWPAVMYPVCLVWSYAVLAVDTAMAVADCMRQHQG